MKIIVFSLFSFLFLASSCGEGVKPVTTNPEPTPVPIVTEVMLPEVEACGYVAHDSIFNNWTLVFEENFDQDLSQWTPWRGGAFNEELQYYRAGNVFVENDLLYIKGERTKTSGRTNPFDETIKSFDFASARVESKREFGPENTPGQQSIRFSARLRLVNGHGLWPAWWSYNDPWPTKGEIDILEARGNTPFEFQSNFHYGVNVNQLDTDPAFNDFHFTSTADLSECFHIYELEWSKNEFIIRLDGEIVKTYDVETYEFVDDFFNKKHRLVLNLAIGGWFFSNLDISRIPNESYLVVDWVRVYHQ